MYHGKFLIGNPAISRLTDDSIYILKIQNVGGGRSTVSTRSGSTINTVEVITSFVDLGGSMIAVEMINSKLKLSHEKAIASCVDPGGDQQLLLRG